jgi:hypothetical protein
VKGESTAWYASFWRFCGAYLEARFGARWCLSPEQSLSLHAGNWTVSGQLAARSPRAGNKVTKLPHGTSLHAAAKGLRESHSLATGRDMRVRDAEGCRTSPQNAAKLSLFKSLNQ